MAVSRSVNIRLQAQRHWSRGIVLVNVIAETSKVDHITCQPRLADIIFPGLHGVVRQQQRVNDAGFARAVRAEDERERLDWHPLGFTEGLEVANAQFRNHAGIIARPRLFF
jgi:hypothetical protein